MKELRADIEALAKMRASTASSDAAKEEAKLLAQQAESLKNAEKGWRGLNTQAKEAKQAFGGLQETLSGFTKNAIGGAGLGSIGSVLAAGSITAMVSAVGVIVGQSIRMAYEFEKSSTRAAQAMSIGFGGTNLSGNIATLQKAALSGTRYNVSQADMAQAIAAYGASSGAGVNAAAAAAPEIAQYARAYGLEPQMVAQTIGQAVAMTGKDFGGEARGLFGAAEDAGNLGRRLPEFIQASTSMLARLQASNPGGNYSIGDAAALIANISKKGGYYGTASGAASFFNAGQGLMSGMSTDPAKMAFAIGAGIKQGDIMLERDTPQNEMLAMQYAAKLSGGNEYAMKYILAKNGVSSPDALKALDALPFDKNGRPIGGMDALLRAIAADYRTNTSGQSKEGKTLKDRTAGYETSELGQYEKLFTSIQNKELALGKTILDGLSKEAGALGDFIAGDWKNVGMLLVAALGANVAASLLLAGKGLPGGVGGLLRGGFGSALTSLGVVGPLAAIGGAAWMYSQNSHGDSWGAGEDMQNTDDWGGMGRDYWVNMYHRTGGKGVPKDIIARLLGRTSVDTMLNGLAGVESNFGKNQGDGTGALGIYQMEPSTAAAYAQAAGYNNASYYTYDSSGHQTLTAAGKKAFLNSPKMQRAAAKAYLEQLQNLAKQKGLNPNDAATILGAYYAGDAHIGQPGWVAGQDQAGNTNTMTEAQYAAAAIADATKGERLSDGKGGFYTIEHHTKITHSPAKKPTTQSRVATRRKA